MQPQDHQLYDPPLSPSLPYDIASEQIQNDEQQMERLTTDGIWDTYNVLPETERVPTLDVERTPPAIRTLQHMRSILATPTARVVLGLMSGGLMLYLISRFVNIPATLLVLRTNLATPRGILLALLSGVAFLTALALRGLRWRFFLNPIGKVSLSRTIQIFVIGSFLNFLLPVRGGEVAKSVILKRVSGIPISRSLPTVAMDKAMDLLPALFIMILVPLFGVQMSPPLWFVLGMVGGLLLALVAFIALAVWQRNTAITLLHRGVSLLPAVISKRVEGFATGFVDALLIGASRPRTFIPAVLLTLIAVIFEGLFAMLAFWTVGYQISFGTALFGYTVYNMFFILPTPPGQVGSNEVTGLLVFHGLLNIDAHYVTAMFIFSHPWAALMLSAVGLSNLSALGLNISTAMHTRTTSDVETDSSQT